MANTQTLIKAAYEQGRMKGRMEGAKKCADFDLLLIACADAIVLTEDGNGLDAIAEFLKKQSEEMERLQNDLHTPDEIIKFCEEYTGIRLEYKKGDGFE